MACRIHVYARRIRSNVRNNRLIVVQVNLLTGVVDGSRNDTSTAGAGSLSLEFSILSRLIGDPMYERVARRAVTSLWDKRDNVTGLLGRLLSYMTHVRWFWFDQY
jgi:hypothetical protein